LPVLGRLFSNNSGTNNKTEIILSITPHILRPPAVLDASVRSVFSGTESNMRERALQLDPIDSATGAAAGAMATDGGTTQGNSGGAASTAAPRLPLRARPPRTQGATAETPSPAPEAPEIVRNQPVVIPGVPGAIVRLPPMNNNTRSGVESLPAPAVSPPAEPQGTAPTEQEAK
jgi:general secretion pathway protein D